MNHFWNTFDQVLLRPALFPYFDPTRLLVPDKVDETPILHSRRAQVGLSDHLPLVAELTVEKEHGDG